MGLIVAARMDSQPPAFVNHDEPCSEGLHSRKVSQFEAAIGCMWVPVARHIAPIIQPVPEEHCEAGQHAAAVLEAKETHADNLLLQRKQPLLQRSD